MSHESNTLIRELFGTPEFHASIRAAVGLVLDSRKDPVETEPVFYTRHDLRRILHLSLVTIDKYTSTGIIEGKKVGRRTLYTRESVEKALSQFSIKSKRA